MVYEDLIDIAAAISGIMPIKAFLDDTNREVTAPFIDEIFHYPQCAQYCNGDFKTWDPKITTPPGLYLLTYLFLDDWTKLGCSLSNMRVVNFLGGVALLALTFLVRRKLGGGLTSLSIFMSPLLTIYYSLFYTDVWSAVVVFASYVAVLYRPMDTEFGNAALAALIGLISVAFRQTNIIWNAFIVAAIIDRKIQQEKLYTTKFKEDVVIFFKQCLKNWLLILPFAINFCLFVGFAVYNDGITFGDKSNHEAVLHFAQVFYCFTFIVILTVPLWISADFVFNYIKDSFIGREKIFLTFSSCFLIYQFLEKFTFVHPFIMADNRHYTFYIMRRFINRTPWSKYQLIPVYHFCCYTVYKMMSKNIQKNKVTSCSNVMMLVYLTCCILTIVPSPLFEPRYFILPFIFWRVMVKPNEEPVVANNALLVQHNIPLRLIGEAIWSFWWTQAIYWVFLNFTFTWEGLEDVQRIIW